MQCIVQILFSLEKMSDVVCPTLSAGRKYYREDGVRTQAQWTSNSSPTNCSTTSTWLIHCLTRWIKVASVTSISNSNKLAELVYLCHFYRTMHFSAKFGIAMVIYCLSVCPSVTFRYHDHIGWNSSKIISRPDSLRPLLGLTPTWAIWCNGNTPKIGAE